MPTDPSSFAAVVQGDGGIPTTTPSHADDLTTRRIELTLDRVIIRVVDVPLRRPIVSAVGSYTKWPFILIDLLTQQGIVGRSYLEPYKLSSARYIVPAIEVLGEALVGQPLSPAGAADKANRLFHLHGRQGVSLIAVSAIDMAIWDALAQAAGLPLAAVLGGSVGPIRAYNTNGLWLIALDEIAQEASELVSEGDFTAIKLRLGRGSLSADVAAIGEVRSSVGSNVEVMADFNQGLDYGDALRRLHALDDENLYWFEEPVVFDSYGQQAALAREIKTPIQIGENIYGAREFLSAVQVGAADLFMPDLMRIGGVTGFMKCAAIAAAANIPLSNHLYPEFSGHLLRASESADWLEWRDWGNPLLKEPFEVFGGNMIVPDRPGAGIDWDHKAVAKYLVT